MVSELEVRLTALQPELEEQTEKVKQALVEVERQTREIVENEVEGIKRRWRSFRGKCRSNSIK